MDIQKNNVIVSQHIKDCIMNSVRDSIPFEVMVRSYLDETHETFDEIKEDISPIKGGSSTISSENIEDISAAPPMIDEFNKKTPDAKEDLEAILVPTPKLTQVEVVPTEPISVPSELVVSPLVNTSVIPEGKKETDTVIEKYSDEDEVDTNEFIPAGNALLDCIEL